MIRHIGGCQCGAVRYEISCDPTVIYACYCTECQRQSGSAFAMTAVFPQEHFRLTEAQPKSFSRTAVSGRALTCWFCGDCGTRIFHTPGSISGNCNLKPGTLDDTSWLRPTLHVWTRSAQPWVSIPDNAANFETQPADRGWLLPKLDEP